MTDQPSGSDSLETRSAIRPLDASPDVPTRDFEIGFPARPRCPNCHLTFPLSANADDELVCLECGGTFRVERLTSATTIDEQRRLGELELLEKAGRGATGTVWKAWDSKLRRLVAVKIPHDRFLAGEHFAEQMLQEARSVAQLEHEGIVRLYEVRSIDDVPMLITGFIQGLSLQELLKLRRLPLRTTAEIVAAIAEALDYAHSKGCFHRDIKPGNIMMATGEAVAEPEPSARRSSHAAANDGEQRALRPIIVDFGLALGQEAENVLTIEGQLLGTIAYMSPEQAYGHAHKADARTDVYCLGVVLYEMLTGELPFRGSSAMILHQIRCEEPLRPRQLNDRISRDLETICLKALNKEPDKRYQTAGAMAGDLRSYLLNKPIKARPAGPVERGIRWCKRNPKLAAMSGLAAASLLFAFVMLGIWNLQKSAALYASRHSESMLALDRALDHLNKDEGSLGLLWLGRSLQLAPQNAADLQFVIRANLSSWMKRAAKPLSIVLHEGEVTAAELSPDGQTAASGGYGKALLWDAKTGRPRCPPLIYDGHVWRIRFSPDGKVLVTATGNQSRGNGEVKFWNTETGQEIGSLPKFSNEVNEVQFTKDGQRLLSISGTHAQIWDMKTRAPLTPPLDHGGTLLAGAISPDGKLAITCGGAEREIKLWDLAAGSLKKNWRYPSGGGPMTLAFCPDGRSFASGHLDGKVFIRRVNLSEPAEITLKHQSAVTTVAFSPAGGKLLTASADKTARLWDTSTGKMLIPPLIHEGYLVSAAFSGDGRYLVTAGNDKTARVWETTTGRPVCLPLQHQASVQAVALNHDGSIVLTGSYDLSARTWSPPLEPQWQRRIDMASDTTVGMAALHPDGRRLIAVSQQSGYSNRAHILDLETGNAQGLVLDLGMDKLRECRLNQDGRLLALATTNESLQVWDLNDGRRVDRPSEAADSLSVNTIAFQSNGKSLLTSGDDGNVYSWDMKTWEPPGNPLFQTGEIKALAVSSDDSQVLAGCWNRLAILWRFEDRQELKRFFHQDPVSVVAFSPDGGLLATGGTGKIIRIWNGSGNHEHRFSLAHPAGVNMEAFSRTGRLLATACEDGAVRFWDLTTGKQIGPPLHHDLSYFPKTDLWIAGKTRSLEFSRDDTRILTAGADQSLRIWTVPSPRNDDADELAREIEAITMMKLDPAGVPVDLEIHSWQRRRDIMPSYR